MPKMIKCQNCDFKCTQDEWSNMATRSWPNIQNLDERVAPGEVVPFGECPQCGALVHLHDAEPLLTAEDINDLQYFWKEKRDLTCWCDWERKKDAVEKMFPYLMRCWKELQAAEVAMELSMDYLDNALDRLCDE